ncbi:MAG: AAA family ATPase [Planctomycetes bacterium]|nr:AAA family ATPase [Planctomycetota bacterium]
MILESIQPRHFGPFGPHEKLKLQSDVTVLTGANDSGKSMLLRLIALMCKDSQTGAFLESDVNNDYQSAAIEPWSKDSKIGCLATFNVVNSPLRAAAGLPIAPEFVRVDAEVSLVKERFQIVAKRHHKADGTSIKSSNPIQTMPKTICLPRVGKPTLRDEIELKNPTLVERELLEVAFDSPYSTSRWEGFSATKLDGALLQGQERLNRALSRLFPRQSPFTFQLRPTSSHTVIVHLIDSHGTVTRPTQRGRGIQSILSIAGVLLRAVESKENVIILYDEPEESLHADSQHLLRTILEEVAAHPLIQVIYATHSPAMINPMRPESIRLIRRVGNSGIGASKIEHRPCDRGFQAVRASLGMVATDSLFFAPVTLLLEGVTEQICIPLLVSMIDEAKHYPEASMLLSRVAMWDFDGCDYEKCCGFAKAHGATPVLLLDGDKKNEYSQKLQRSSPALEGVPVIFFENSEEFEDIIGLASYVNAIHKLQESEEARSKVSLESFNTWLSRQSERTHFKPRTKQIAGWLRNLNIPYHKAEAMYLAIANTPIDQITTTKIIELLNKITEKLQACSK